MEHWRHERPTAAQVRAIKNISSKWNIMYHPYSTKGEACDEIERLRSVIAGKLKNKSRSGNRGYIGAVYTDIDLFAQIGNWGRQ